MHQLLKTARYPNIECELRDIHFGRGTEPAAGEQRACKLTVLINAGGVSREIEMPGEITREKAGLLRLSGSMPLRMSDFGLIPPSVPDIVKVGDALKVSFEFLFNPR